MLVVGTRPEGIKMLPVYFALKHAGLPVVLCSTTQHNTLLNQVFTLFQVRPDVEFNIMRPGQDLFHVTILVLENIKNLLRTFDPSIILVQGDTTSTMATALAAFYLHIPIGHIEAGLRTKKITEPFPEEMNRRFVSLVAEFHYAPTSLAADNLIQEGIEAKKIFCTGNTVVDALRLIQKKISNQSLLIDPAIKNLIEECSSSNKKLVLLTAHRRESFNGGIESIFNAIKKFAKHNQEVIIAYVSHPNPLVIEAIKKSAINHTSNIRIFDPLPYQDMIYLLIHADCIATDSGGLYEEAISLGKDVLILRNETERTEGILAGLGHLVGVCQEVIIETLNKILYDTLATGTKKTGIYGDGHSAERIVQHISENFLQNQHPSLRQTIHSIKSAL